MHIITVGNVIVKREEIVGVVKRVMDEEEMRKKEKELKNKTVDEARKLQTSRNI